MAPFAAWIANGNLRQAGDWLARTYAREVLGLCNAIVADHTLAEDLAQDTFGRAFAALAAFRGDASPRTWLLKIARNRCIDHLRSQGRMDPLLGDEAQEVDEHAAIAPLPPDLTSRKREVALALGELSEGERALVVLRFAHGLSYDELAMAFGIRQGTARMRLSRALARMKDTLSRQETAAPRAVRSFAAPSPVPAPARPASLPPPIAAQSSAPSPRRSQAAPAPGEVPPASGPPPAPASIAPFSPRGAPLPQQSPGAPAQRHRSVGPGASADSPADHALATYFAQERQDSSQLHARLDELVRGLPS